MCRWPSLAPRASPASCTSSMEMGSARVCASILLSWWFAKALPHPGKTAANPKEAEMAYDRKQGGHKVAQANRPDYRLEVGRAEVPGGEPRGFAVLDPARAATLRAWAATLIPAGSGRPDAAE